MRKTLTKGRFENDFVVTVDGSSVGGIGSINNGPLSDFIEAVGVVFKRSVF